MPPEQPHPVALAIIDRYISRNPATVDRYRESIRRSLAEHPHPGLAARAHARICLTGRRLFRHAKPTVGDHLAAIEGRADPGKSSEGVFYRYTDETPGRWNPSEAPAQT